MLLQTEKLNHRKEKLMSLKNIENLMNVHEIRRFLGLVGFFRRFVPRYAELAEPLIRLTRKDVIFMWNTEQILQRYNYAYLKYLLNVF